MNRMWRNFLFILVLASLWALSGFAIGSGVEAILGIDFPIAIILASLNLILGLTLFLGITRDPTSERIFFEGPQPDEPGRPAIGCLWLLPLSLILVGLWLWLVAFFMRVFFPH